MAYFFSTKDIFHQPEMPVEVFRVVHDEPMPLHQHEFSELVIVSRGEALHLTDNHEQLIMMGDVFLIHPSMTHGYEKVNKLELINILFSAGLVSIKQLHAGAEQTPVPFAANIESPGSEGSLANHLRLDTDQLVEINEMVRELEEDAAVRHSGSICMAASGFLRIMGTLIRWHSDTHNPSPNLNFEVTKAFSYIAENYSRRVSLSDLTDVAGMSESSLTRAFRKSAGLTPIEYVISYRIRQSCRLLQYTDKNVTEVAFDSGFSDSNYFSRKFHDMMSVTPLEYRHQSRKRTPPYDSVLPQPSQSPLQSSRRIP